MFKFGNVQIKKCSASKDFSKFSIFQKLEIFLILKIVQKLKNVNF
jgi:hypothetical protein